MAAACSSGSGSAPASGSPATLAADSPLAFDATTYLLRTYLRPAASTYLAGLSEADRTTYLTENPWITWSGDRAGFSFEDFLGHLGSRKKTEPAFDAFDLSAGENNEFGTSTVDNRHFTEYSARHAGATVEADIPELVTLMNPIRST